MAEIRGKTIWDIWNPIKNGINYISTGAGVQPPTVGNKALYNWPRLSRNESLLGPFQWVAWRLNSHEHRIGRRGIQPLHINTMTTLFFISICLFGTYCKISICSIFHEPKRKLNSRSCWFIFGTLFHEVIPSWVISFRSTNFHRIPSKVSHQRSRGIPAKVCIYYILPPRNHEVMKREDVCCFYNVCLGPFSTHKKWWWEKGLLYICHLGHPHPSGTPLPPSAW